MLYSVSLDYPRWVGNGAAPVKKARNGPYQLNATVAPMRVCFARPSGGEI